MMAAKARMNTDVVIVIQSRSSPPNPVLCPLLDRPIDMDSCGEWFSQIVVVPNVIYDVRNEEIGELTPSPLQWRGLHRLTVGTGYILGCIKYDMHRLARWYGHLGM